MSANQQSGALHAHPAQAHPADAHDGQTRRSPRIARALRRRAGARQPAGIILLVVLVLLALFTMLLISFVVATVANRQSVMQSARIEQAGDSPQTQLHEAIMQVVRGPRDSNSVLLSHSLLEDLYGHNAGVFTASQNGIRGQISQFTGGTIKYLQSGGSNTPLLQFQCTTTDFKVGNYFSNVNDIPYGFYNGLVITMIDGPATGRSSRITGYYFDTTSAPNYSNFQVLSFDGAPPNAGDTFLINGRPFSGTGFGYRPVAFAQQAYPPSGPLAANQSYSRLLDAFDPGSLIPTAPPNFDPTNYDPTSSTDITTAALNGGAVFQYALLPNPRRGVFQPFAHSGNLNPGWSYLDPAGPGGANEDYDAPDFQNMLLAMRIWADPSQSGTYPGKYHLVTPLPSLHRPDLLWYWNNRWKASTTLGNGNYLFPSSTVTPTPHYDALTYSGNNYFTARNLLRKISLRPLAIQDDLSTPNVDESENPNFTGSNPNFDPIDITNHQWDVDNDGDGTPDSVWVDLGFPVQTGPDGRRYKPLAGILCIDMDGKLNLNAHSSWAHAPSTSIPGLSRFNPVTAPFAQVNDGTPASYYLKIGSGYGPPEISLHSLFEPGLDINGAPFVPTGELFNLLAGNLSSTPKIEGRYGELGAASMLSANPYKTNAGPGVSLVNEPFNWLNEMGYPQISNLGSGAGKYPQLQNLYLPTTSSFGNFTTNSSAFSGNIWLTRSAFGSPPDLDGDGMIGLDLRGQPLYIDYPNVWGVNNGMIGLAQDHGWGEANESVDDPYELDLSYNARNDGYSATLAFSTFATNLLATNGSTNTVVSIDAPFTAAELEQILRWNDADAPSLPNRLRLLAPNAFTNPTPTLATASNTYSGQRYPYYPELAQMRNLVTTHSFDLSAPSMVFTAPEHALELQASRFGGYGAAPISGGHISQLLASRIYRDNGAPAFNVNIAISQLLPPDLLAGEKMNINRPFGNGVDDNQNNVIDEVGEYEQWWGAVYNGTSVQFDVNNDGVADGYSPSGGAYSDANTDGTVDWRDGGPTSTSHGDMNGDGTVNALDAWASPSARQLLARHLYVLMMLLKDDNFVVNSDINGDGYPATGINAVPGNAQAAIDVAYYIAQWAVNIVDFRDSDAIMTPFEFDIYPFVDNDSGNSPAMPGTWDVDGVLTSTNIGAGWTSNDDTATYRGLVWGAERPELLITETSAVHDRRTRDTDKDGGIKKYTNDPTNKDPNFDQVRRPQGSLFVELYNPNSPVAVANEIGGRAPNELYVTAGTDASGAPTFGLNLAMLAPPKTGSSHRAPVWRLAVLNQVAFSQLQMPARQVVLPYNSTTSTTPNINPNSPNPNIPQAAQPQVPAGIPVIDRVAYFTSQPVDGSGAFIGPSPTDGSLDVEPWRQFYPQVTAAGAPEAYAIVPPNHYAVVGSASPLPDPYAPAALATAISTPLGVRDFTQDSPSKDTSYPLTSIQDRYNFRIIFTPNFYLYDDITGKNVVPYGPPVATGGTYSVVKQAIGIPMAPLLFNSTSLIGTYKGGSLNYGTGATGAVRSTRFSITEPSAGYPITSIVNAAVKTQGGASVPSYDENAYYDPNLWMVGAAQGFPDLPYDQDVTYFLPDSNPQFPYTSDQKRASFLAAANADSTTAGKTPPTVVYLQRLANPILPWDANANPYIIVDQMAVDLTMYNSEKNPAPNSSSASTSESLNGTSVAGTKWTFDSRQRSGNPSNQPSGTPGPDYSFNNIWYPFGWFRGGVTTISNFMNNSTWGYLNYSYGYMNMPAGGGTISQMWNGTSATPAPPVQVNGQPNGSTLTNQKADYLGDPTLPFPWFNWNDRPYVSSKELMLVPVGSPASMLAEMTLGTPTQWPGLGNVPTKPVPSYDPNDPNVQPGAMVPIQSPFEPALGTQSPLPKGEFGHLPNMFLSPHYTGAVRTAPSSPNFYRLLDYVQVPSRFTGTETWLTPTVMQGNYNVAGVPKHQLHPPFNRISRFRDPGRVNLNTIFDPFVWQGIMDEGKAPQVGSPPPLYLWQTLCNSRLGTTINQATDISNAYLNTSVTTLLGASPAFPSILGAPFRSSSGHTLVPLNAMRTAPSGNEREVDGTMLRASLANSAYPLFEYPGPSNQWKENNTYTDSYTGATGVPAAHDNANRNPYFAYKAMRRLDNLLTTRSNVYAVWITLGYFEVSPAPSNDPQRAVKYPDGWVLGQEVGSDTGDIKRHRAFYMYDRSIPVGFERGENHNVQKGILLERFIE